MRRREFIGLIGGAVTWPLAARTQQLNKVPRIGVLWNGKSAETHPYFQSLRDEFEPFAFYSFTFDIVIADPLVHMRHRKLTYLC